MGRFISKLRYLRARLRTRTHFHYRGLEIEVHPGVVNPTRFDASLYFAEIALTEAPANATSVLELGCGCGLVSLLLAQAGHKVTAVDVDPKAVFNTATNINHNHSFGAAVLLSDWDSALADKRFAYVICNPPFLPGKTDGLDGAFNGGDKLSVLRAACAAVRARLDTEGRGLIITSSQTGRSEVLAMLAELGFTLLATRKKRDFNEVYFADVVGILSIEASLATA